MDLKFEKLLIWQKSKEIYLDITKKIETKDNEFLEKIKEAALKTMDCIAEGYEVRYDDKKIKKYLEALWYNTRTTNMLVITKDLWYLDYEKVNHILWECINLNKMIYSIVCKIKRRNELTTYNNEE